MKCVMYTPVNNLPIFSSVCALDSSKSLKTIHFVIKKLEKVIFFKWNNILKNVTYYGDYFNSFSFLKMRAVLKLEFKF